MYAGEGMSRDREIRLSRLTEEQLRHQQELADAKTKTDVAKAKSNLNRTLRAIDKCLQC